MQICTFLKIKLFQDNSYTQYTTSGKNIGSVVLIGFKAFILKRILLKKIGS